MCDMNGTRSKRPRIYDCTAWIFGALLAQRDLVIGMSSEGILFVVAAYRDENVRRIISARKATKDEKDRYHAGDREIW